MSVSSHGWDSYIGTVLVVAISPSVSSAHDDFPFP